MCVGGGGLMMMGLMIEPQGTRAVSMMGWGRGMGRGVGE